MSNLFLESLDSTKLNEMSDIKKNKAFAMRLIDDLSKVFHTNHLIDDNQNDSVIKMKRFSSNNLYNAYSFNANKDGVKFIAHALGYYTKGTHPLGTIFKEYPLSTADNSFGNEGHGHVTFHIPLVENDLFLKDKLRDIVYLMEQKGYTKIW